MSALKLIISRTIKPITFRTKSELGSNNIVRSPLLKVEGKYYFTCFLDGSQHELEVWNYTPHEIHMMVAEIVLQVIRDNPESVKLYSYIPQHLSYLRPKED